MNWKKTLPSVLLYAAFLFVFFMFRYSKDVLHPDSGVVIENVVESISLSLGIVGGQELDRLGHRWIGGLLIFCIVPIFVALSFLLIREGKFNHVWGCAFLALFAFPFPLALYLNQKQSKSNPQQTSANVS